ncbi:iron hydrogenase [Powellomyces hirtus]|nr:iron hydrogenase [Powellomyces hirtus]
MTFSGAVLLTDLNDFITPSQACIKPVEVKRSSDKSDSQIRVDDTGGYYEVMQDGGETKLETASISLNDCLACSGCITSAESVLITLQSQKELYDVLLANKTAIEERRPADVRTVVVSIAPQSRASIAAKYDLTPLDVHKRLLWFFKQHLGAHHVFDTAFSRDFSLLESAREFVRRYQLHHNNINSSNAMESDSSPSNAGGILPMLASACPGWICYAEKTHDYILPYIDSTKSPQQIMGSLVKDYLGGKIGQPPNKVYHVSVMPCYDKKLEASRQDFYNDVYATRDVDCVITTGEVEKMFGEQGLAIHDMQSLEVESLFTKAVASSYGIPALVGTEGSSSGGYLSCILRYAAHTLFGVHLTLEDIENGTNGVQIKAGRNNDLREYSLCLPSDPSKPVLKFAIAYGFRNIQNLVRKINPAAPVTRRRRTAATATSTYDYIEIMACPSGCINGGGQLKADPTSTNPSAGPAPESSLTASRNWIAKAEDAYRWVADTSGVQLPESNAAIGVLYNEWLGGPDTEKATQMLHTQYRAVEKSDVNGLAVKW